MSKTAPRPIGANERAEFLDALRGFALLGIFAAHVPGFSGWDYLSPAEHTVVDSSVDDVLRFLRDALVRGKFYSLFSLLFGVGLALQIESAARRADGFRRRFRRRQLGLLAIGLCHSALWHGDILVTYALLGLAVLPFANTPPRRLLALGLAALALRAGWGVLTLALADPIQAIGRDSVGNESGATDIDGTLGRVTVGYFSASWHELLRANASFLRLKWMLLFYDGRFWSIAGCFLLGAAFGKWRVHARLGELRDALRRVACIALPVGVAGNLALAWLWPRVDVYPPTVAGMAMNLLYSVAIPTLAIGFAAGLALAWQIPAARRVLRWLAPPGRTALTSYLSQTLFGIAVFYGVGFGLRGQISLAGCIAVTVAVFAAQIVMAKLWLGIFRFGPVEWAWRCATYASWLPLRHQAPAVPDRSPAGESR